MATDTNRPPPDPIPLGPFELIEPIGRGGMGEVWRGLHRDQGVPVAVKVMTGDHAREDSYVEAFRNEVQSVAALDHPGIILVFDQSQITDEAEAATDGALVAGSPYLAMEYCSLGSLERFPRPLEWPHLRSLLLSLLEALAHAHARGVIHRDIKPENVLLAGPKDPRPGLKLSDFGLAHPAEKARRTDDRGGVAGTPLYMSPEQAMGAWRNYGPWSDLYSLGCVAWELATGCPPFVGKTPLATLAAQVRHEPPPLDPLAPVPEGYESWVKRLLEKDPDRRYRRAADVAWALLALGDAPEPAIPAARRGAPTAPGNGVAPTLDGIDANSNQERFEALSWYESSALDADNLARTADALVAPTLDGPPEGSKALSLARELPAEDWASAARDAIERPIRATMAWLGEAALDALDPEEGMIEGPPARGDSPPLPEHWDSWLAEAQEMRLVGAGLGLYGLRRLPLVDRRSERRMLWDGLRDTVEQRRARAIVVQGPAGTGKSHLMRAFTERTHEVGAATVMTAVHSPHGGPADGIPYMLGRHLGCVSLERVEILHRTSGLLRKQGVTDPYEWQALAEIIRPSEPERGPVGPGTAPRFASPIQRFVVIQRLLARLAKRRPLLLVMDDVQWGADTLAFADFLLGEQETDPIAVMLVLGLRDDALDDRPLEREHLGRVKAHDLCATVPIGPLAPAYRSELVQQLLGLEGDLADQVERRTGGNPLFAVQLVGDWVERGVLQVGRTGFELKPGERAVLPDDIHQLWTNRLERLVRELARRDGGQGAHDANGADEPDQESINEAVAHTALESLTMASALGQVVDAVEWQLACRFVDIRVPGGLIYELVTRNLAHSTELGWGFGHAMLRESLERRARERGVYTTYHRAIARMLGAHYPRGLEGLAERVARHLAEAGDLQMALAPLLEAATERFERSEFTLAHALLDRREDVLTELGTPEGERPWCQGWLLRAKVMSTEEQALEQALKMAQRAARAAREHGLDDMLPQALVCIGRIVERRGHLTQATQIFKRALPLFERADDLEGQATCLDRLGAIALQGGHRVRARECFEQAQAHWAFAGDPSGQAGNLLKLGYVALANGRYGRAADRFQRAYEIYELLGSQLGLAASLNALAETARVRGDLDGAEIDYRGALERYKAVGSGRAVYPQINLCLVMVARSRYSEARREVEALLATCRERGQRALLAGLHCLMLACAAGLGDWLAWDDHINEAAALLEETGLVEKDDAWSCQLAGELALRSGQRKRARQAFEISFRLWRELGHDRRAGEVWQTMSRLPKS